MGQTLALMTLAQVKTMAQTLTVMIMNSHRLQSLYPALLIFTHAKNSKYATMKTHVPKLMTSRNATKATNSQHGSPTLRSASRTRPMSSGKQRFTAGNPTLQESEITLRTVASDATTIESS